MSDKVITTEGLVKAVKIEGIQLKIWNVFIIDDPAPFPIGKILFDESDKVFKYYEGAKWDPRTKHFCAIRDNRWASLMSKINQRV